MNAVAEVPRPHPTRPLSQGRVPQIPILKFCNFFLRTPMSFGKFSGSPTRNSGAMGRDPTIYGPGHTFLLAIDPLAIVPSKADYPVVRTVGLLAFSYQIVGNEEIRVRE